MAGVPAPLRLGFASSEYAGVHLQAAAVWRRSAFLGPAAGVLPHDAALGFDLEFSFMSIPIEQLGETPPTKFTMITSPVSNWGFLLTPENVVAKDGG